VRALDDVVHGPKPGDGLGGRVIGKSEPRYDARAMFALPHTTSRRPNPGDGRAALAASIAIAT
jgi:hypothetical protein